MIEPRFLLDTNICFCLLEGLSDPARDRVEKHAPGEVVTSAICYAELLRGIDMNAGAAVKIERFFAQISVADFGREAAAHYAALTFRRHSFARLIAAHTLSLGLVLVTNNEADFADVAGLVTENWTL